jgi:tryptophan synthase alpha chain
MNRLDVRFAELCRSGRSGLIPFVTVGDPSLEATVPVMHALVEAGADAIELGVPFSDPMADGPVIQHANERALARGVGLRTVLDCVRAFRTRDGDTPVVLMGYLNPLEVHGIERFAREAVEAGVDGVLLVDCPIEEDATLQPLRDAGLRRILLVAPTTSEVRLTYTIDAAEGFLYYVSFAGVTGAAKLSAADIGQRVTRLRQRARVPVAVGFGIKDAGSARAVAAHADAVVIGSALVAQLGTATTPAAACERARAFLAPIRVAMDAAQA